MTDETEVGFPLGSRQGVNVVTSRHLCRPVGACSWGLVELVEENQDVVVRMGEVVIELWELSEGFVCRALMEFEWAKGVSRGSTVHLMVFLLCEGDGGIRERRVMKMIEVAEGLGER